MIRTRSTCSLAYISVPLFYQQKAHTPLVSVVTDPVFCRHKFQCTVPVQFPVQFFQTTSVLYHQNDLMFILILKLSGNRKICCSCRIYRYALLRDCNLDMICSPSFSPPIFMSVYNRSSVFVRRRCRFHCTLITLFYSPDLFLIRSETALRFLSVRTSSSFPTGSLFKNRSISR